MPNILTPRELQLSVQRGSARLKNFRRARLMFLRNYTGPYYDKEQGEIGEEAMNMIFNAIRVLVPNIVMNFPEHNVSSRFLESRDYAEMLGLALSYHDKDIDIKSTYRQVIVDAIFTLGVLKTGLAESDSLYAFDEYDEVDTGEVYTECVDFDNLLVDPTAKKHLFRDAKWIGDRSVVARSALLESGLYNNALVEQLPRIGDEIGSDRKAHLLSQNKSDASRDHDAYDEVEIAEIWVPGANRVLTVPASDSITFDDYLRDDEYYGPDTGPYTFLSLTPPVPGNPLPIPVVGVWNDLHVLGNRMAKKIIDQAERQKDVVAYRRAAADDAEALKDEPDGGTVATDDPDSVKVLSFGGQRQSNEVHLAQLQGWFNQMAANPQALAGQRFDAQSATEARLLAQNANVGLEDMKDLVYQMAAAEASKRAWYMHTDPMIEVPLIRRQVLPAAYRQTPLGPVMEQPAELVDVQVMLTPEARRGDWMEFHFEVEPESMGRQDSQTRFMQAMDFAVKIMPAAMQAAQSAALLGIPFDVQTFITRMAKDRGIKWMDEVWFDPDFQMKMAMIAMRGPAADGSQGQLMPNQQNPLSAVLQNGQPGQVAANPGQDKQDRQQAQSGANEMQAILKSMGV